MLTSDDQKSGTFTLTFKEVELRMSFSCHCFTEEFFKIYTNDITTKVKNAC